MIEVIGVSGLAELRKTLLNDLPKALQGKALQIALTKAAKPMMEDARARAPKNTGRLKSAIYSVRDRLASTPVRESRVILVRHGKKSQKKDRDAFYWKFIEFGHGVINTKKSKVLGRPGVGFFGKTVRAMPARPFMRPAFEANKFKAIDIFVNTLKPAILKVAARANRKSVAGSLRAFGSSVRETFN